MLLCRHSLTDNLFIGAINWHINYFKYNYICYKSLLGSCGAIRNTSKFGIKKGVYQTNQGKALIETPNDTILVFSENEKRRILLLLLVLYHNLILRAKNLQLT
jgi:hypothetical protein